MARIDDEVQHTRDGAGALLDSWEKLRAAQRWLLFNGKITMDGQGDVHPTDDFTPEDFVGANKDATPELICGTLNAMNRAQAALTDIGFAPFYQLRS